VPSEHGKSFAVWITGLPASGKSTITAALVSKLAARGVDAAVLESDVLRGIFTQNPTYDEAERDAFYQHMAYIGGLLYQHGVPVIFDATANRRMYRDRARQQFPRFIEVYVDSSLETCMARDPKGIYRKARDGASHSVPGLQAAYEAPEHPEVTVDGARETPEDAAEKIVAALVSNGCLGL